MNIEIKRKKKEQLIQTILEVNSIPILEDNIKDKIVGGIKNFNSLFSSNLKEVKIFFLNIGYVFNIIFSAFVVYSLVCLKHYIEIKRKCKGHIFNLPFFSTSYPQTSYYGNSSNLLGLDETTALSIFKIAFFNSVVLGVILGYLVFFFALIFYSSIYFFIKDTWLSYLFFKLSSFFRSYPLHIYIIYAISVRPKTFKETIIFFCLSQLIFKYSDFFTIFRQKENISFISFNLKIGIKKSHVMTRNILPHCTLEFSEILLEMIKTYFFFIDFVPSLVKFKEMKTRSFFTTVFLLSTHLKNLNGQCNTTLPFSISIYFILCIFLTYFVLIYLYLNIKHYFIKRSGFYEKG